MVSAAILLPLCIAVPIVPDADLAIGLLAALIFVAHFWTSSATASIQTITPPHLRGQMTSIYNLCTNIVGFCSGPVVVGAVPEQCFSTPAPGGLPNPLVCGGVSPL